MPAIALTLLGTVGIFGIGADESGMIVESIDDTSKKKTKDVLSRQGNRIGRSDYDYSIDISIKGKIAATSGWAQKISAELTIANAISAAHLPTDTPAGKTYIDEVKRSRAVEDWIGLDISAEMLPFFPSA